MAFVPEEWRDIDSYEGIYKVSNLGRVRFLGKDVPIGRNMRHAPAHILKPGSKKSGYQFVILYDAPRKPKAMMIHRLVALSFLEGYSSDRPFVNHRDGKKTNNIVSNLEWCTHDENIRHAWKTGLYRLGPVPSRARYGENNHASKITKHMAEKIIELRRAGVSGVDTALKFGISTAQVSRIYNCHGWPEVQKCLSS